jgi:hypothetical protein
LANGVICGLEPTTHIRKAGTPCGAGGSTFECVAVLDLLKDEKLIDEVTL